VAEFGENGRRYVLGDGEILVVDVGFLDRLNAALERIPWADFPFPAYQGGTERAYLEAAAAGGRLALLDQRNIYLPNETPFEPCDLFSDDGRLVYAKLKGPSSTFSHLCTQAEAAAEMLLRHPAARDALLDRVAESRTTEAVEMAATEAMAALEAGRRNVVRITLLLLGAWRGEPNIKRLPLVSRLRLRRTAQHLADLGLGFEVAVPVMVPVGRGRPAG
jgi:uncharacterized protein (TIGR04141 family)